MYGHTATCGLLLDRGADLTARDRVSDARDREIEMHIPHMHDTPPYIHTVHTYIHSKLSVIVQNVLSIRIYLLHYPLLFLPSHHSMNPAAVIIYSYSMYLLDYEWVCMFVWEPASVVACMYVET